MTTDIDRSLRRLGMVADHPGLDDMTPRVLARIHADGAARGSGMRIAGIAGVAAVLMGVAAAGPWASPAVAGSRSPLGGDSALAPSTLLLAAR